MKKNRLLLFIIIVLCFSTGYGIKNSGLKVQGSPAPYRSFSYQSIYELCSDFATSFDEVLLEEIEYKEKSSSQEIGAFRSFLTDRQSKNKLLVPYFKDEIIPIRNEEEVSRVSLFTSVGITSPEIWYRVAINNENITIITEYLSDDEVEAVDGKSASWYLRKYHPSILNVGKFKFFSKHFKGVYEKELKLKDRTIKALVYKSKSKKYPSIQFNFIYDEIYVSIVYNPQNIKEDVLEDISFEERSINRSVALGLETQEYIQKFPKIFYDYDNADFEMSSDLSTSFDEETLGEIEKAEGEENRGTFKRFLTDRQSKNTIFVPYFSDQMMILRKYHMLSAITILPSGTYSRPCIWYYGVIGDYENLNHQVIIIKITYLEDDEIKWIDGKGAASFLSNYYPHEPNIDNFETFDFFNNVYEKELKLKDRTVNALVYEYKDDRDVTLTFIYDDVLVQIECDSERIDDDVFSDISFQKHSINMY